MNMDEMKYMIKEWQPWNIEVKNEINRTLDRQQMGSVAHHYNNQIATSNDTTNSSYNEYSTTPHKRRVETEAEANERRRQNALRMRQARMNETYEAGVERRIENANRMRRSRELESPLVAAERKRKNALRMRERRLNKRRIPGDSKDGVFVNNEIDYENFSKFEEKLQMYTNNHNFVPKLENMHHLNQTTSNMPNDRYNNMYRNYTEQQQQMMLGATSGIGGGGVGGMPGPMPQIMRESKAVQTDPDYSRANLLQKIETLTNELKQNNLCSKLNNKKRRISI